MKESGVEQRRGRRDMLEIAEDALGSEQWVGSMKTHPRRKNKDAPRMGHPSCVG